MTLTTRRRFLGSAAALGMLPLLTAWARPGTLARPPSAKKVPFREVLQGITIDDPYRWMENPADPDWMPFVQAEDAYARATLARISGRNAIASQISALTGGFPRVWSISIAGEQLFLMERPVGASSYRLVVRPVAGGASRVLIEPDAIQGDHHSSLDWWKPSPDGSKVVYGLSLAGSENAVIHVLETRTGRVLPDRIPRGQFGSPAWLPDGSGFFYNQLATEGMVPSDPAYFLNSRVRLHRIGSDPAKDPVIFGSGVQPEIAVEPSLLPKLAITPGSDWVIAGLGGIDPATLFFAARLDAILAGKPGWRQLSRPEDKVGQVAVRGDRLYLLSFSNAPHYRLLRADLPDGSAANARVVVPESRRVIIQMWVARNGIYLVDNDGGINAMRRLDNEDRLHEVPLPLENSILFGFTEPNRDGIYVNAENSVTPPRVFAIDASDRARDTGLAPQPDYDVSKYRQSRAFATARDGTRIPMTISYRADVKRDGSAPTIVTAYGAYGSINDPYFNVHVLPWLERGGVYVMAHVRGGGEYGQTWHEQGQKATKANSWRDLIACCEQLIADKWTRPAKLALMGKSAGGVTIPNAMVERPDLMAVVFARVPFVNAVRIAAMPGGPANFAEFGDPSKPEELKGLIAMDAYHRVKKGARYPAVMLTGGLHDPRVPAWQPAKMAARLAAYSSSGKPILFRVESDAGHGTFITSTREQLDSEFTDMYAFALWQMGELSLH